MSVFIKPSPFDHPSSHILCPACVCDDLWVLAKQTSSSVFVPKYQHAPRIPHFTKYGHVRQNTPVAFSLILPHPFLNVEKRTAFMLYNIPFSHKTWKYLFRLSFSLFCIALLFLMTLNMLILMILFSLLKKITTLLIYCSVSPLAI